MTIFSNRLSRKNFAWGFVLLFLMPILILACIAWAESAYHYSGSGHMVLSALLAIVLACVLYAFCLIYYWSLIVRRLHDVGQSGWLSLIHFIPVANLALIIFLFIVPGDQGPNRYGPPHIAQPFWSSVFRGR